METADTATTVETGEGNQEPVQTTTEPAEPFIVGANSVYKDVPSLLEGARTCSKSCATATATDPER